jgi:Fe(3+) dicitrate transport protein
MSTYYLNLKPVFLLLQLGLFLQANSQTVKGLIKDETGKPMTSCEIFMNNGLTTRTANDGHFQFTGVLPGDYELKTEIAGQIVILKFIRIEHLDIDLGEVIVAKNIQLKEVSITQKYVNRHIERMPDVKDNIIYASKKNEIVRLSTSTANLAQNNSRQLFAKVPGVHIWESDGSGVQMGVATRGLNPNRMWEFNTRQNGYDISADPFGYPEAYYTPSVESLDRIEVIRGASSLQYGSQFGGVVNYIKKRSISGKKIGFESMQTIGNYGMFSSFNAIGGNYKKFSYYGNINYRKSDGWRDNNDYTTWNGFVNIGYQVNKKLALNIEFTRMNQLVHQPGGLTDSMFHINAQQSARNRNWFDLKWTIPAMTVDYKISNNQSLQLKAFGLLGDRSSIGFMSAIQIPDTIQLSTGKYAMRQVDVDRYANMGAEARHAYHFMRGKSKHTISSGIRFFSGETIRYRNNNGDRGTAFTTDTELETRSRNFEYTTKNIAAHTELLYYITPQLSIVPGVRFEHLTNSAEGNVGSVLTNQSSKRTFILAGLGAQYKFAGTTNFYANFSQAYRPVLFSDLTLDVATDSIDNKLADSKGYNIDIGYRGSISNLLSFDVSVFYLMYGNRVGSYALNGKNFRTNIGSSVSKGLESYIEFTPTSFITHNRIGHISIFNSTALIDAVYVQWNNPDLTKSLVNKKVENAPQQIIRSGITYNYKFLSTTLQHSFVGEAFADAMNTINPTSNAQIGLIPSYQVWDWSLSLKVKKIYQFNAGVNNVLDEKYFTRRAGGYPGPGLLPADGRLWYIGVGVKL